MKIKTKAILPLLMLGITFVLFSFTKDSNKNYVQTTLTEPIEIPKKVKAILKNKCMACHSNDSKGGISKMKINFDKLINGDYATGKTINKLEKITKTVTKGKMPPQKFLSKYPSKRLTDAESKLLISWAAKQGNVLKN